MNFIIFIFIFKFLEIQAMVKMAMMLHASVQPQGKPISRFDHVHKNLQEPIGELWDVKITEYEADVTGKGRK